MIRQMKTKRHKSAVRYYSVEEQLLRAVVDPLTDAYIRKRRYIRMTAEYLRAALRDLFLSLYHYAPLFRPDDELEPLGLWTKSLLRSQMKRAKWKKLHAQTAGDPVAALVAMQMLAGGLVYALTKELKRAQEDYENDQAPLPEIQEQVKRIPMVNLLPGEQGKQVVQQVSIMKQGIEEMIGSQEMQNMQDVLQQMATGGEGAGGDADRNPPQGVPGRFEGRITEERISKAIGTLQNISLALQSGSLRRWRDVLKLMRSLNALAGGLYAEQVSTRGADVVGVTTGANLSLTLPAALAKLRHPVRRKEFYRQFVDRSLPQYQVSVDRRSGRGGVIVVMDVSGSMVGLPGDWASALALDAFGRMTRKNRPFGLVAFSDMIRDVAMWRPYAGDVTRPEVFHAALRPADGGTDFTIAASEVLALKEEYRWLQKTDVLWVTDGQAALNHVTAERYVSMAKHPRKGWRTMVVYLGEAANTSSLDILEPVKVWQVPDLDVENLLKAGADALRALK